MQCEKEVAVAGFEDGKTHKPRNAGRLWSLEQARKPILPQSPQKQHSPADALIFFLYLNTYLFIYLAAPGLSCGTQYFRCRMRDL